MKGGKRKVNNMKVKKIEEIRRESEVKALVICLSLDKFQPPNSIPGNSSIYELPSNTLF
jgi:hypothetical protein